MHMLILEHGFSNVEEKASSSKGFRMKTMLKGRCHSFDFGFIGDGAVGILIFVLDYTQKGIQDLTAYVGPLTRLLSTR